eukprot:gene14578-19577_t
MDSEATNVSKTQSLELPTNGSGKTLQRRSATQINLQSSADSIASAVASVVSAKPSSSGATNIKVAVRCRPLNADEKKSNQATVISCETENRIIRVKKRVPVNFYFDEVYGMYSRQTEVFESCCRPIVEECLAGFNCTMFAYGQTGTGKTHTMEGNIDSPDDAGIIPRAAKAIFEGLEASGMDFNVRVSYLEIYNEDLMDLLSPTHSENRRLKLCEDVKKGVICQNLEEFRVMNEKEVHDYLSKGITARQTASTLMNHNSSRSHAIFTIKVMVKTVNDFGDDVVKNGQLNLVDLAGSECVGRSGAKNDRAREAGSINQSLLTLGRVITALVDHHGHIPYRDSKLTRLLQESLGGKAKTCIIATLSPSMIAVEESLSTLEYAARARNIKNQPQVIQTVQKGVAMKEYFSEIETLRMQLALAREKNGVYVDPATFASMEAKIETQEAILVECESALKIRTEEVKIIRDEKEAVEATLSATKADLEQAVTNLEETKVVLQNTKEELQTTVVELKSTEEVVKEQVVTESTLTNQGV